VPPAGAAGRTSLLLSGAAPAAAHVLGTERRRIEVTCCDQGFVVRDSERGDLFVVNDPDAHRAAAGLLDELNLRLRTSFWDFDDPWINIRLERGERWYRQHRSECPHDLGAYIAERREWICICGQSFVPGDGPPRGPDPRDELDKVTARAATVMDPDAVARWVRTPIAALGGDQPIERVAHGDAASVLQLIAQLENDAFT